MVDKTPPNDEMAEKYVLGSMLLDKTAAEKGINKLKRGTFYSIKHQEIFSILKEIYEQNGSIDFAMAHNWLQGQGKTEEQLYITQLVDEVVAPTLIDQWINTVLSRAVARTIIEQCRITEQHCFDEPHNAEIVLAKLISEAETIQERVSHLDKFDLQETVNQTLNDLELRKDAKLYQTGLPDFDRYNILQKGNLIVVSGRPSVGKTAFALTIADINLRNDIPVLIFSGEMPKIDYIKRFAIMRSGVGSPKFLQPAQMTDDDWNLVTDTMDGITFQCLIIQDGDFGLSDMRQEIKNAMKTHKTETVLVILDALNDIYLKEEVESRRIETDKILRRLGIIAAETQAIMLIVCHLRKPMGGRSRKPTKADLKETGNIEYKADVVILIHREEEEPEVINGMETVEITLAKNRNGPTFPWMPIKFELQTMRFYNVTEREQE